jgi:hypothetical protein
MQNSAENANSVCASGGSFLIQLDSEELVASGRGEKKDVGVDVGVTERRGESKLDYWIKTLRALTSHPTRRIG